MNGSRNAPKKAFYSTFSGNFPEKIYEDAALLKKLILEENKGLSGIYRWVNKINNKNYVGSGKDLAKRLAIYYKKSELIKYPRPIHKALLKYEHVNFRLEILEYCSNNNVLIKREQYYLDLLKPDYNILKIAYSLAGFKHSKESIAIQKAKAIANRGVKVWVLNRETGEELVFPTQYEAGDYLGISPTSVRNASEKGTLINKIYLIKNEAKVDYLTPSSNVLPKATIKVLNLQTKEESVFYSQSEVAKYLGVSKPAVSMAIKSETKVKDIFLITKATTFSTEALAKANLFKVLNTETNESINFKKQTEIAKYIGVSPSAVAQAIKEGRILKGIYLITK